MNANNNSSQDKSQLSRDAIIKQIRQSDWSEIDQDFYSDDDELSVYFGEDACISQNYCKTAKSVASNDALSDRQNSLLIQKSQLQHSVEAQPDNGAAGTGTLGQIQEKKSGFMIFKQGMLSARLNHVKTGQVLEPSSARLKEAEPLIGQSSFIASDDMEEQLQLSGSDQGKKLMLPQNQMTDHNSIYRKLYNRDVEFFLWVIEKQQKAPYVFKLHVQANSKNEMKAQTVKRSIQALIPPTTQKKQAQPKIQIQLFSKKKQFKVFIDFYDSKQAQKFFSKTFVMKNLAILDETFSEMFERQMRVYLVKTEAEFTRLALLKYKEEIKLANQMKSSISSQNRGNTGKTQACSTLSGSRQRQLHIQQFGQGAQNNSIQMMAVQRQNKTSVAKPVTLGCQSMSIVDNNSAEVPASSQSLLKLLLHSSQGSQDEPTIYDILAVQKQLSSNDQDQICYNSNESDYDAEDEDDEENEAVDQKLNHQRETFIQRQLRTKKSLQMQNKEKQQSEEGSELFSSAFSRSEMEDQESDATERRLQYSQGDLLSESSASQQQVKQGKVKRQRGGRGGRKKNSRKTESDHNTTDQDISFNPEEEEKKQPASDESSKLQAKNKKPVVAAPLKGTKLKDIREVGEAIEDSPPKSEEGGGEALTEEQILGLI